MGMTKINGVNIDNIPASHIGRFKNEVLKKDRDKFFLFDGREGSGKSILAMQYAKILDEDFNVDKIAFNSEQFINKIKDAKRKKGDCIILDEAFSSANSRQALSGVNRAMITCATEMRQLNLFIIIVLPSFFDLDKYFAIWRCDSLFHVYFSKDGGRGQYVMFPFKKKMKLYIAGKKTYNYGCVKSPYPPCRFYNQWVVDEQEYRKRKAEAFRERKKEVMTKYEVTYRDRIIKLLRYYNETKGIPMKDMADAMGLDAKTLTDLIKTERKDGAIIINPIRGEGVVPNEENDEIEENVVPKSDVVPKINEVVVPNG